MENLESVIVYCSMSSVLPRAFLCDPKSWSCPNMYVLLSAPISSSLKPLLKEWCYSRKLQWQLHYYVHFAFLFMSARRKEDKTVLKKIGRTETILFTFALSHMRGLYTLRKYIPLIQSRKLGACLPRLAQAYGAIAVSVQSPACVQRRGTCWRLFERTPILHWLTSRAEAAMHIEMVKGFKRVWLL